MNADHAEAVEFAKISKRENRVYVGNLSYDVKYGDLMEFMRVGSYWVIGLVGSSPIAAVAEVIHQCMRAAAIDRWWWSLTFFVPYGYGAACEVLCGGAV